MTAPAARGGFNADGSWNPDGSWSSPLDLFVLQLVKLRRQDRWGPPRFADLIRTHQGGAFIDAFGNEVLANWDECTTFDEWRIARTTTSAGETVKRCGYGPTERAHWFDGWYLPPHLRQTAARTRPNVDQEHLDFGRTG